MTTWPLFVLIAFAAGSIPFGLVIARARGVDLRAHGSGNIGATNVWRVMGWRCGLPCFLLDVLKGLAPTLAAGLANGAATASWRVAALDQPTAWWWLAVLTAAILGHMFTPLAGFKGGKGVATGLGAALGVWPVLTVPGLGALLLWGLVAWRTRMVSVASCAAAAGLPLFVYLWSLPGARTDAGGPPDVSPFLIATGVLGALVIVRHRSNLARVWAGTENRIGGRRGSPSQGTQGTPQNPPV